MWIKVRKQYKKIILILLVAAILFVVGVYVQEDKDNISFESFDYIGEQGGFMTSVPDNWNVQEDQIDTRIDVYFISEQDPMFKIIVRIDNANSPGSCGGLITHRDYEQSSKLSFLGKQIFIPSFKNSPSPLGDFELVQAGTILGDNLVGEYLAYSCEIVVGDYSYSLEIQKPVEKIVMSNEILHIIENFSTK
jgi:hypothetical protein